MLVVAFILFGLTAGGVALWLSKSSGMGIVLDFGLGVIGAVSVGSLFSHLAATGKSGIDTASALAAALTGAAALLFTVHGLRDRADRRLDPLDPISKFQVSKSPGAPLYASRQDVHHALVNGRADRHPRLRLHAYA